MSDPKIAAIPVVDCGEPLPEVRTGGALPLDARRRDDSGIYAHLREGMLNRLVAVGELLPDGTRLPFVEGHRPPSLQRLCFARYAAGPRTVGCRPTR
ncbi:hypothetical protein ACFCYX_07640 [Streptomyces populi]|uniref:hypothetical protein n=1 Tax=Streptomyces populi TaxID=2058924 RepID=UPI00268CA568